MISLFSSLFTSMGFASPETQCVNLKRYTIATDNKKNIVLTHFSQIDPVLDGFRSAYIFFFFFSLLHFWFGASDIKILS